MVRNFLSGLALGGVVAGVGLGVASQMVPLDPSKVAEIMVAGDTLPATKPPESVVEDKVAEVTTPADAVLSDLAAKPEGATATGTDAPLDAPLPEKSDTLLSPAPDVTAPETAVIAPESTDAGEQDGVQDEASKDAEMSDVETADAGKPEGVASQTTPDPMSTDATTPDVVPAEASEETAPADTPEAASEPRPESSEVGTAEPAEPEATPVDPAEPGAGKTAAEMPTLSAANPLEPVGSLVDQEVAGVTSGRLPRIGADAEVPKAADTLAPSGVDASQPPVVRFAQAFQNPGAKPLYAVLLMDPGTDDVNRAELAALPFPVTFVVDPMAANAVEAAQIYRDAGQEVVMLANGIPKGATASDLEQSFAKLTETLPEAVALIDTADATFQDNRGLAGEVVTLMAAQGRGVVTFDRGLNAADQVARREGVPSATIFRSLDDDGEDAPLIRRYLDRAAFKAAQEGKVVVIGTARPETIAALMEWAVEGRAASVALAPITAVMATK